MHEIVQMMWAEPSIQQWSVTPYKMLEAVCASRAWPLTVRNADDVKTAGSITTLATINIPIGLGITIVGAGKGPGAFGFLSLVPWTPCLESVSHFHNHHRQLTISLLQGLGLFRA